MTVCMSISINPLEIRAGGEEGDDGLYEGSWDVLTKGAMATKFEDELTRWVILLSRDNCCNILEKALLLTASYRWDFT